MWNGVTDFTNAIGVIYSDLFVWCTWFFPFAWQISTQQTISVEVTDRHLARRVDGTVNTSIPRHKILPSLDTILPSFIQYFHPSIQYFHPSIFACIILEFPLMTLWARAGKPVFYCAGQSSSKNRHSWLRIFVGLTNHVDILCWPSLFFCFVHTVHNQIVIPYFFFFSAVMYVQLAEHFLRISISNDIKCQFTHHNILFFLNALMFLGRIGTAQ